MTEKVMSQDGILDLISRIRETSSEILRRELERNNIEGIVPAHGKVIYYLFGKEKPVPISDIVRASGRVKSTITGMVTTLAKYGYLSKIASPDDKRSFLVELTPKGRQLRELFDDISEQILALTYGDMENRNRENLIDGLNYINRNLKDALSSYSQKE